MQIIKILSDKDDLCCRESDIDGETSDRVNIIATLVPCWVGCGIEANVEHVEGDNALGHHEDSHSFEVVQVTESIMAEECRFRPEDQRELQEGDLMIQLERVGGEEVSKFMGRLKRLFFVLFVQRFDELAVAPQSLQIVRTRHGFGQVVLVSLEWGKLIACKRCNNREHGREENHNFEERPKEVLRHSF